MPFSCSNFCSTRTIVNVPVCVLFFVLFSSLFYFIHPQFLLYSIYFQLKFISICHKKNRMEFSVDWKWGKMCKNSALLYFLSNRSVSFFSGNFSSRRNKKTFAQHNFHLNWNEVSVSWLLLTKMVQMIMCVPNVLHKEEKGAATGIQSLSKRRDHVIYHLLISTCFNDEHEKTNEMKK